ASAGAVHDHAHLLERDQPAAEHGVELGKDGVDLLLRLDAFDDDRQVDGELDEPVGVNLGCRAETHDAAEHGGSGVVPRAEQLDDLLIQRLAVVLVGFADVDPHQHAFALKAVHGSLRLRHTFWRSARSQLAAAMPRTVAASAKATLEPT